MAQPPSPKPGAQHRVVEYLGLDGPSEVGPGRQIPMWWGSSRAQRTRAVVLWLVMAAGAYFAARWALPADDNIGGKAPLIFAALIYIVGTMFTERASLRFPADHSGDR